MYSNLRKKPEVNILPGEVGFSLHGELEREGGPCEELEGLAMKILYLADHDAGSRVRENSGFRNREEVDICKNHKRIQRKIDSVDEYDLLLVEDVESSTYAVHPQNRGETIVSLFRSLHTNGIDIAQLVRRSQSPVNIFRASHCEEGAGALLLFASTGRCSCPLEKIRQVCGARL